MAVEILKVGSALRVTRGGVIDYYNTYDLRITVVEKNINFISVETNKVFERFEYADIVDKLATSNAEAYIDELYSSSIVESVNPSGTSQITRTFTVNPAGQLPSEISQVARTFKDNNPDAQVMVYIKAGVYVDYEINQHDIEIFAEDGVIIHSNTAARSIISDRHIGADVKVRIYGRGIYLHDAPNGGNDQESLNFRSSGSNIYIEAKKLDSIQLWNNDFQKIIVKNCDLVTPFVAVNRANSLSVYENCKFLNGLSISGYILSNSNNTYKNCKIELPSKVQGDKTYDIEGNLVVQQDLQLFIKRMVDDIFSRLITFTGSSGTANVVVDDIVYIATFNTDLETTLGDWVDTHAAALAALDTAITVKRAKEVTVVGSSGTANINVGGTNYIATFNIDSDTTAIDWITTHSSALGTAGYSVLAGENGTIIVVSDIEETFTVTIANVSGDLGGTIAERIKTSTTYEDDVDVTFVNVTGNLSGSVVDIFSYTYMLNYVQEKNNNADGMTGILMEWFHTVGAGQNVRTVFRDCELTLFKRKSIGLKIISRANEINGKKGGVFVDGLTIIDNTGGNNTTAIVHGSEDAKSNPITADIKHLTHNCDTDIYEIVRTGYSKLRIISDDDGFNTAQTLDSLEEFVDDSGASIGGIAIGEFYYNTTDDNVVKRQS